MSDFGTYLERYQEIISDFRVEGEISSLSENSIHFFELPQTAIGTTHTDRSSDSFSSALGQPVQRIQCTFG